MNVPAPLASFVLEQAVDLPSSPTNDDRSKDNKTPSGSSTPAAKPKTGTGEVKMPKWLKLGQSKRLYLLMSVHLISKFIHFFNNREITCNSIFPPLCNCFLGCTFKVFSFVFICSIILSIQWKIGIYLLCPRSQTPNDVFNDYIAFHASKCLCGDLRIISESANDINVGTTWNVILWLD